MDIFKNMRLIVIILLVVASSFLIASPYLLKRSGLLIDSVSQGSRCSQIQEGSVLNSVEGVQVKTLEEFNRIVSTSKTGQFVNMVVNNLPANCAAISDGNIGITVAESKSRTLDFGVDIQGGVVTVLGGSSNTDVEGMAKVIKDRMTSYGLPETKVTASGSRIMVTTLADQNVKQLVVPGDFVAKIAQGVSFENSTGVLKVGNEIYDVLQSGTSVVINGTSYSFKDKLTLNGIEFTILNVTNTSAIIEGKVFDNSGVEAVVSGHVQYNSQAQFYDYYIPLGITQEASDNFIKVAKGIGSTPSSSGELVLQGQLVYYFDGEVINALSIPYSITLSSVRSLSIVGYATDSGAASRQMNKIFSIINSGQLPSDLHILETSPVSAPYGSIAIYSVAGFSLALSLTLLAVSYARHKNMKFGYCSLGLAAAEMFIIIGVAALTQTIYPPGWIIDIWSVAGIMAIGALGSIQMTLMSEKIMKNRDMHLSHKYKTLISMPMLLNASVLITSFLLLFTSFKGFGLAMFVGFILEISLMRDVYKDSLKL